MTKQPKWVCIANLGDKNPIDYGGYFIFEDRTKVYAPEAELLEVIDEDSDNPFWQVYRFSLDRLKLAPVEGKDLLIPYNYDPSWSHPISSYNEWFNRDLDKVFSSAGIVGMDLDEFRLLFCSENPVIRAQAYRAVGEYHGFINLDQYPLTIDSHHKTVLTKRYRTAFKQLKRIGGHI